MPISREQSTVRALCVAGLALLIVVAARSGSIAEGQKASAPAQGKKPEPKGKKLVELKGAAAADLVRLKREVDALETLFHLEPTEAQVAGLLALAAKTAAKPSPVAAVRAGADYRKIHLDLRGALVKNDEVLLALLLPKLIEVEGIEETDVDESFELTAAAIKAAPAALDLFTAAQIVSYLALMENEVPDPVERVILTLIEGLDLPDADWKDLREESAEEVAWLVHGFNSPGKAKTVKAVAEFLDRGHKLKEAELEKESAGLEKAARKIVGAARPTLVLQHYMEREMAEFLSNPQALAALKARKEHLKKEQPAEAKP